MSFDYNLGAKQITSDQINLLRQYYINWEGDKTIDLKFRFIKVFGIDRSQNTTRWILLHWFVNRRRISNENLPKLILKLFDMNFIPIRLFQSVGEWLAPNRHYNLHMIRSGILPLENDDSLLSSIECARQLLDFLPGLCYYVYSGNKSIHVWWLKFNFEDYFPEEWRKSIWSQQNREKLDRFARKKAFDSIQDKLSFELDKRNAIDTRRVVPIIGTVNAFTGRKVELLNREQLMKMDTDSLKDKTLLNHWH